MKNIIFRVLGFPFVYFVLDFINGLARRELAVLRELNPRFPETIQEVCWKSCLDGTLLLEAIGIGIYFTFTIFAIGLYWEKRELELRRESRQKEIEASTDKK